MVVEEEELMVVFDHWWGRKVLLLGVREEVLLGVYEKEI